MQIALSLSKRRIAIVGSRGFPQLDEVRKFVKSLPEDTVVVSGGAPGVDRAAELAAKERGLEVLIFLAEWDRLGKRAGFVRNKKIVQAADEVVAFWDGVSPGTRSTLELARAANKPVKIVHPSPENGHKP